MERCQCGQPLITCSSCGVQVCASSEETSECGITNEQMLHETRCCACYHEGKEDYAYA